MAKPVQSTDNLFKDIRVDKNLIKEVVRVSYVDAQDIITKIKSDNYVLNSETLYVLLEAGDQTTVVLGDGKNVFSDSVQLGGSGSGGVVESVTGDLVDDTDPANPVIDLPSDVLLDSDASNVSSADKIVRYSNIGAVNTATPQFPENAVPLALLDVRVPTGGTAGSFLANDNTWKTPPNTTYTAISEAEATTGTATTARAVSAQSQKRDILNRTKKYDNLTGVNSSITFAKVHADRNLPILCTGGSPLTFTIPAVATVAWEVGDVIEIYNNHGAITTIVAGAGVNLNSVDGLTSISPSGYARLVYLTTNQWQLIGDLVNPV